MRALHRATGRLEAATIGELDFDTEPHILEVTRDRFVLSERDPFEEVDHVGAKPPLVGERLDPDLAVEQCRGGGVLKAELAIQSALRLRPVDVLHHRRTIRTRSMAVAPIRSCSSRAAGDGEMRSVLRWEELDRQPRIDDAKRTAVSQEAAFIETFAIEGGDESLRRFQDVRIRGEARLASSAASRPDAAAWPQCVHLVIDPTLASNAPRATPRCRAHAAESTHRAARIAPATTVLPITTRYAGRVEQQVFGHILVARELQPPLNLESVGDMRRSTAGR